MKRSMIISVELENHIITYTYIPNQIIKIKSLLKQIKKFSTYKYLEEAIFDLSIILKVKFLYNAILTLYSCLITYSNNLKFYKE